MFKKMKPQLRFFLKNLFLILRKYRYFTVFMIDLVIMMIYQAWQPTFIMLIIAITAQGLTHRFIPLQAAITSFINWLLGLTLTSGVNRTIMKLTRPLWILLGHYGFY